MDGHSLPIRRTGAETDPCLRGLSRQPLQRDLSEDKLKRKLRTVAGLVAHTIQLQPSVLANGLAESGSIKGAKVAGGMGSNAFKESLENNLFSIPDGIDNFSLGSRSASDENPGILVDIRIRPRQRIAEA